MKSFLERIKTDIVVGDGGTGSLLMQAHPDLPCAERANLAYPQTVTDVHLRFIAAGSQLIETNTFGANRFKLEIHGDSGESVRQLNSAAVKLARDAREVSGKEVYISGSIGPTGLHLDPGGAGGAQRERLLAAFREQAEALEERGVDLFMVETFVSPAECLIAVEAVRSVSSLPIVASLTFADEWSPRMGRDRWADISRIAETGVHAVGTNCSMGPSQVLEFLEEGEPPKGCAMSVQPNVGVPEKRGGRFIYPRASPEYFAYFARESVRLGARIVGGCCGTEPHHIAAVGSIVSTAQPRVRGGSSRPLVVREHKAPVSREENISEFARKLDERKFVNVVQLDPPKGSNTELALSAVDRFTDSGRVDAVDVNSNPMARLHMDSLWLSMEIERRGMETIPHITPRDASLMGLEGNLLGAWKSGVRNVLVITGDPSQSGDYPGASDVYQTDSVGLVQVVSELNRGFDWTGNAIGDPPAFTIGVAVNPNADDVGKEADRLKRKVDQGAHFAMTQVFFEWGCWERFLGHFGGSLPIPALIAVWPLTSYRLALRLHHEVPGIVVPEDVQERLENAGKGAREEGFQLAREVYAEAKLRAAGAYIIAPFKSPAAALEILEG